MIRLLTLFLFSLFMMNDNSQTSISSQNHTLEQLKNHSSTETDSTFFENFKKKYTEHQTTFQSEKIYVQLDKPMYQPGETIWFNAFVRNANTLQPTVESELIHVELLAPNNAKIKDLTLVIENGMAKGDILLPVEITGGRYTLRAFTNYQKNFQNREVSSRPFEKEVVVQKSILPNLRMKLDFKKESYTANEKVIADIELKNLEDDVLRFADFSYVVNLAGKQFLTFDGKTDFDGKATIAFQLPRELTTNDGLVNVMIPYNGQTESISRSIPIVLNDIDLQFMPESGFLVSGDDNNVAFKAIDEFGEPVDIEAIIKNSKGETVANIKSYHQGMGIFQFKPKMYEKYTAEIIKPKGISKNYRFPKLSDTRKSTLQVVEQTEDYIKGKIIGAKGIGFGILATINGKIVFSKFINKLGEKSDFKILTKDLPIGILRLNLVNSKGKAFAERLVFINTDKRLNIDIQTDKKQYAPREKVNMQIAVTDHNNQPVSGQLSMSVVDDKLISFADDKQAHILASMLLESELKGEIKEPNFYFEDASKHPDKDQKLALDLLMMTQGWRRIWDKMELFQPYLSYPAEKREIRGRVAMNVYKKKKVTVSIPELNLKTTTDEKGNFKFENVKLTKPVTLHIKNGKTVNTIECSNYGFLDITFQTYAGNYGNGEVKILKKTYNDGTANNGKSIIKGKIVDGATGEGLIGTPIYIIGTNTGVVSDVYGNFSLNIPSGNVRLRFSYIGYSTQEQTFSLQPNETIELEVSMEEGIQLHDVTITTYGRRGKPKKNRTKQREKPTVIALAPMTIPNDTKIINNNALPLLSVDKNNQIGVRKKEAITDSVSYQYALNFQQGLYQPREYYVPKYTSKKTTKPEERNDFRSTIYWNPNLQLNKKGKANIEFYAADNITTYRIIAEGFGNSGDIGRTEQTFFTQMPVGMTIKMPTVLLNGDQVNIPLTLMNNTEKAITGNLQIEKPSTFKLSRKVNISQTLDPGERKTVILPFDIVGISKDELLKIKFEANGIEDAFVKNINVISSGHPIDKVISNMKGDSIISFTIYDALPNSIEGTFNIYPKKSDLFTRISTRMIRRPTGCFEQTSSKNYPNILVYKHLKEVKKLSVATSNQLISYMNEGYKNMLRYEIKSDNSNIGKGFDWYGKPDGHEGLTAYALMQFNEMKDIIPISESMMNRTVNWLLSRRDGNGSWHYKEKDYHSWIKNSAPSDAYIVWALTEAGYAEKLEKEIDKSYRDAIETEDAYTMALMANVLFTLKDTRADTLVSTLIEMQSKEGSWNGKFESVTYSQDKDLTVETTALATLALLKTAKWSKNLKKEIEQAVHFLNSCKTYNGFGSTQATVLSLKVFTEYERLRPVFVEQGAYTLFINNEKILKLDFDINASEAPIIIDGLGKKLVNGKNEVKVVFDNKKNAISFDFDLKYASKKLNIEKNEKIQIKTKLTKSTVNQGETVRLTTTILNNKNRSQPNTIALVGIPSGLSLQPWQLKELETKGAFDYYELMDGFIVFHFRKLNKSEEKIIRLDLKADISGKFNAPASSVYLYYNSTVIDWEKGTEVIIE